MNYRGQFNNVIVVNIRALPLAYGSPLFDVQGIHANVQEDENLGDK